jgi:hypothetical protein
MTTPRAASRVALLALLAASVAYAACSSSSSAPGGVAAAPDATTEGGASCSTCVDGAGSTEDGGGAAGEASEGSAGNGAPLTSDGASDAAADGAPVGDPTGVTATRVSDFLGSIGVCVHIAQGVDSPQPTATAIAYAGIRNLRDDGRPSAVAGWITVHQEAGTLVDMLPNADIATTIGMAKTLRDAGALLSVEGPNEPNNFPVTYEGGTASTTTFLPVARFQRDLFQAVRAESSLDGTVVFHSSESGGSEPDDVGLQFLTIPADSGATMPAGTKYADYANTHNYVCGHSSQLVDNACWNASDPTLNGDWDGLYVEYGHTWNRGFAGYTNAQLATLPRVTTETGWVTSGSGAITPDQQGKIFLNLYLAAYRRGWAYTFLYMLRDDPVQGYWGLFDTTYAPKTSGTYLHNFTTILADGSARPPGRLNYSIAAEPATVHDILLQKSSGSFDLVVWDEHPGGGSDTVTVDLGAPRGTVKIYDPTTGTAPTKTMSGVASVQLTLTDHPVILEI